MGLDALPTPEPVGRPCPDCGVPTEDREIFNPMDGKTLTFPCLVCNCRDIADAKNKVSDGARAGAIPKAYRAEDLKDWKDVPGTDKLLKATIAYAADLKNNVKRGVGGIFLGEGFGTGKSKCAYYLQVEAIRLGIPTYTVNSTSLMRKIRAFRERRQYAAADDLIRKCVRTPFLVYDDLGKMKPHHWDKADVESIIIEREIYGRATIFTSNSNEDHLDDHFGEHLTSRVMKMSVPYIVVVDSKIDMRRPENRKTYGLAVRA